MPISVLVCDDSQFARRAVIRALPADLNPTVLEAGNGAQALEHCRAGGVQIVLLDLNMPGVDGFEVLTTLRAEGIALPVVVVTANLQAETMKRAKDLGATGVLQKPIDPSQIESIVRFLSAKLSPR